MVQSTLMYATYLNVPCTVHDTTYITLTDIVSNIIFGTVINAIYDTTIVSISGPLWLPDTVFMNIVNCPPHQIKSLFQSPRRGFGIIILSHQKYFFTIQIKKVSLHFNNSQNNVISNAMILQEIYEKLSLTDDCLIHPATDSDWKKKVSLPSRLLHLIENNEILKTLDSFFCFDNKPLILFFVGCDNKQALHRAIWNLNESPIVIVIENNAVEIYNGYNLNKASGLLEYIGGEDKLSDFTYFKLVTGKTWEKYQDELSNKNRVDYLLLNNIGVAQNRLKNDGIDQITANALIGKIIFIRYLIDRKVRLHFNRNSKYWSNEDLCELLNDKKSFGRFYNILKILKKDLMGICLKSQKRILIKSQNNP